jgi:hypothetical protein
MGSLLQTVIPAALAFLAGNLAILSRTGRLNSTIRSNIDLLDKLPADDPSRATLEAHNRELIELLVRRQRRRFEPITRAGWSAGANSAAAIVMLLAAFAAWLQIVGVWRPDPDPEPMSWSVLVFYAALAVLFAGFALKAWLRQQREHPAQVR